MAELLERETEEYYKMDPDPFDDRHPGRAVPTCALGHLMKTLFKSEEFMNKVTQGGLYLTLQYRHYWQVCEKGIEFTCNDENAGKHLTQQLNCECSNITFNLSLIAVSEYLPDE